MGDPGALGVLEQFAERFAAVGDLKFFLQTQFGKGLPEGRVEKERIVAETARATRVFKNHAVGAAFHYREDAAPFGQGDDTHVVSPAAGGLETAHFPQKPFIVRRVVGARAGKPRGVDAGRSPEGVHAKARVLTDDWPLGIDAVVKRLLPGVFFERRSVLEAPGKSVKVGQELNRNPVRARAVAEFAQFSGIG